MYSAHKLHNHWPPEASDTRLTPSSLWKKKIANSFPEKNFHGIIMAGYSCRTPRENIQINNCFVSILTLTE